MFYKFTGYQAYVSLRNIKFGDNVGRNMEHDTGNFGGNPKIIVELTAYNVFFCTLFLICALAFPAMI